MKLTFLYNFNNHYNKRVIKYNDLSDYENYTLLEYESANFNPSNGLHTDFILNTDIGAYQPDYLVTSEDSVIKSRWFVISCDRLRVGQYKIQLKRDVLSDYYDDVFKYSTFKIDRGWVDNNNVLSCNKEPNLSFNQIKQSEDLLYDNTGCSWLVGFIDKNATNIGTIENFIGSQRGYDYSYQSLSDFPLNNYTDNNHTIPVSNLNNQMYLNYKTGMNVDLGQVLDIYDTKFTISQSLNNSIDFAAVESDYIIRDKYWYKTEQIYDFDNRKRMLSYTPNGQTITLSDRLNIINKYSSHMINEMNSILNDFNNLSSYQSILNDEMGYNRTLINDLDRFDGKIIKVQNQYFLCNKVHKTVMSETYSEIPEPIQDSYINLCSKPLLYQRLISNLIYPSQSELNSYLTHRNSSLEYYGDDINPSTSNTNIQLHIQYENYYISLTNVTDKYQVTIPDTASRLHLDDAPYDMFCIPYKGFSTKYKYLTQEYNINTKVALQMAQAICLGATSGDNTLKVYDVQVVPYCPFSIDNDDFDMSNYIASEIKKITNQNVSTTVGHIFWSSQSTRKFEINKSYIVSNKHKDINTKQYRLCSPDNSSMYEFSPAMNGNIDYFNVSIDYKPFASYIKVQPNFNSLYGQSIFNGKTDFRGLLYNTNSSITQLTSAYNEYIAQNKNFQQIFDNNIKTQLKTQNEQNEAAWDTMFARSYTGLAFQSSMRAIGNTKEQLLNERLQDIQNAHDRNDFKLQLDNIKSTPNALSKLTSVNIDYRDVPYIEIYGCTSTEEVIYNDYITYNSMYLNTIGRLYDYINPNSDFTFIQGTLLYFNNRSFEEGSDYETCMAINQELQNGIYLKGDE